MDVDMDLAEILGVEDNPFSLFLILILLLGATGYFDPKKRDVEAMSEGEPAAPAIVLPVWQKRPPNAPPRGLLFSAVAKSATGSGNTCRSGACNGKRSPAQQDSLATLVRNVRDLVGGVLPQRARPRHPLLRVRHKMLQR